VVELNLLRGRQDGRLQKIYSLADQHGIIVKLVTVQQLDSKVPVRHQGVVMLCRDSETYGDDFLFKLVAEKGQNGLFLMLDGITDPHNLGACMRSADGAGVHGVIVPKHNSVKLTPVVTRVACGAAETVPLIAVTNLSRTLRKLREQGVWSVAATEHADQPVFAIDLTGPIVMVIGAEGSGIRQLVRRQCDFTASLPMAGEVSSLNLSVAAGICLFEVVRQRLSRSL
jgi:23S rRNA (guanosine2251-2'-O)-methyltransferase